MKIFSSSNSVSKKTPKNADSTAVPNNAEASAQQPSHMPIREPSVPIHNTKAHQGEEQVESPAGETHGPDPEREGQQGTFSEDGNQTGILKPTPSPVVERERARLRRIGLTKLGVGFQLEHPQKMIPLVINDEVRKGHFWSFGTTRCGKTRLIEGMVEEDIKKGYSILLLDPKGDGDLFSKIFQVAAQAQRLQDLMLFNPIFPQHSVALDPLCHYAMPEELVGHITSGVRVGKEPYFEAVAYEVSLIVVQALLLLAKQQGKDPRFNLNTVRRYISREQLERLRGDIGYIDTLEARQLAETMDGILSKPTDYYAKISSTLSVALNELTEGNIGAVLGRAHTNPFIQRLEEGKSVILVAQLGAMLTKRASYTTGKVILSTIQAFVGRRFASGEQVEPPLAIYIDEAQSVLYQGVEELFAKAGGANAWISGFCQSINQLFAEIGEDRGRTILDNCNTKLYLKVADADTAVYVSDHLGEKEVYLPIIGMGTQNISLRDDIHPRVRHTEVLNLKEREFFLTTYSGAYRGRTTDVSPAMIDIKYPDIRDMRSISWEMGAQDMAETYAGPIEETVEETEEVSK